MGAAVPDHVLRHGGLRDIYGRSPHVYRVFFTTDETAKFVRVVHSAWRAAKTGAG
jgi:hypothetical protein